MPKYIAKVNFSRNTTNHFERIAPISNPTPTSYILTEDSQNLVTEDGERIVEE